EPAVKAYSAPPVTRINRLGAVVPAPPRRGPKQTYCRRCNPGARHPIIIPDIITITPVTGSPDITGNRAGRLLIYRQNRRSKIDRYAYLGVRGRQRHANKASQNQGTELSHFHVLMVTRAGSRK